MVDLYVNVQYYKVPNANRENEQAIHAQLWGLIPLGCTPLTYFMELQISFDLGVVCCKLLYYCCTPTNDTKLLGQEVNLHPK
jgi:hypothetical protein